MTGPGGDSVEPRLDELIRRLSKSKRTPEVRNALIEARRLKSVTMRWVAIPPNPDARRELLARVDELLSAAPEGVPESMHSAALSAPDQPAVAPTPRDSPTSLDAPKAKSTAASDEPPPSKGKRRAKEEDEGGPRSAPRWGPAPPPSLREGGPPTSKRGKSPGTAPRSRRGAAMSDEPTTQERRRAASKPRPSLHEEKTVQLGTGLGNFYDEETAPGLGDAHLMEEEDTHESPRRIEDEQTSREGAVQRLGGAVLAKSAAQKKQETRNRRRRRGEMKDEETSGPASEHTAPSPGAPAPPVNFAVEDTDELPVGAVVRPTPIVVPAPPQRAGSGVFQGLSSRISSPGMQAVSAPPVFSAIRKSTGQTQMLGSVVPPASVDELADTQLAPRAPAVVSGGQALARGLVIDRRGESAWRPHSAPGIRIRTVLRDVVSGAYAQLLRFAPGATLPPRRFVARSELFVVAGTVAIGSEELKEGEACRIEAESTLDAMVSRGGGVLLVSGVASGDVID